MKKEGTRRLHVSTHRAFYYMKLKNQRCICTTHFYVTIQKNVLWSSKNLRIDTTSSSAVVSDSDIATNAVISILLLVYWLYQHSWTGIKPLIWKRPVDLEKTYFTLLRMLPWRGFSWPCISSIKVRSRIISDLYIYIIIMVVTDKRIQHASSLHRLCALLSKAISPKNMKTFMLKSCIAAFEHILDQYGNINT